jgi:hypothetical protein
MADKLISQLIAAGAALQDIDLAELQVSGEVFTRKLTGLQLRSVEKLERETQDNVIEGGVGLNASGTFTAVPLTAGTNYLEAADFAAAGLAESVVNALKLLDTQLATFITGTPVVLVPNLAGDTTLANIIPAGYMLEYVIFNEKAAGSPILDLGTTVGGNEVFIGQVITTSDLTVVFTPRMFSLVGATTLYLNAIDPASTWGGGTVDAYFVMKQII